MCAAQLPAAARRIAKAFAKQASRIRETHPVRFQILTTIRTITPDRDGDLALLTVPIEGMQHDIGNVMAAEQIDTLFELAHDIANLVFGMDLESIDSFMELATLNKED